MTRVRSTFVNIMLTVLSTKTINTQAFVISGAIQACPSVLTGRAGAIIGVDQAISTFISWPALTCIASFCVDTGSLISTRIVLGTFVDIFITQSSSEPKRT